MGQPGHRDRAEILPVGPGCALSLKRITPAAKSGSNGLRLAERGRNAGQGAPETGPIDGAPARDLVVELDDETCEYLRRADMPRTRTGCGAAAGATWIFRGGASRRRRGCDVDIP